MLESWKRNGVGDSESQAWQVKLWWYNGEGSNNSLGQSANPVGIARYGGQASAYRIYSMRVA